MRIKARKTPDNIILGLLFDDGLEHDLISVNNVFNIRVGCHKTSRSTIVFKSFPGDNPGEARLLFEMMRPDTKLNVIEVK